MLATLVLTLFVVLVTPADARTRRHRKRSALAIALQPFSLARSAAHTLADPIVFDVPRVAVAAVTAPIRLAYRTTARPVRVAEPADDPEPIRVAYIVPRAQAFTEPASDPSKIESPREERNQDEIGPVESSGSHPMVAGSRAVLRNGIAYAPSRAPQSVKNAIWAANTLRRKPYIWGGGHGSFSDRGYDCSGTVSFALHGASALELYRILRGDFHDAVLQNVQLECAPPGAARSGPLFRLAHRRPLLCHAHHRCHGLRVPRKGLQPPAAREVAGARATGL